MNLAHVRFGSVEIDRVARPHGIATAKAVPAARVRTDKEPSSQPYGDFLPWVLQRAGLDSSWYRAAPLERRVPACLRALKVSTVHEARFGISGDARLLEIAVGALLNGTTEFFRDRPVFDFLAREVLPALAARDGSIRAWSAGCSSGAELYSIAIQLDELGLLERGVLLGTDCRPDAIEQAAAATYGDTALAKLPPAVRARYFEPIAGHWRAIARLRHSIEWRVEDLASATPEGAWDLILWRNAGMYVQPDAAASTLLRLIARLKPGGYLVLGKAERPPVRLDVKPVAHCVYQRSVQ